MLKQPLYADVAYLGQLAAGLWKMRMDTTTATTKSCKAQDTLCRRFMQICPFLPSPLWIYSAAKSSLSRNYQSERRKLCQSHYSILDRVSHFLLIKKKSINLLARKKSGCHCFIVNYIFLSEDVSPVHNITVTTCQLSWILLMSHHCCKQCNNDDWYTT